jgi:hypothetical protein
VSAVILDFPAPVPAGVVLTRQEALSRLPKRYLRQLAAEVRFPINLMDAAVALHKAGLSHELCPELRSRYVDDIRDARAAMQDLLDDLMSVLRR